MRLPLLQANASCYLNNDWHRCTFDQIVGTGAGQLSEPLFGLFVGGGLIFAFYIAGADIRTPAVLLMLLSGVMLSVLPGGLIGVAWTLMFLGVVAGLLSVAERYLMSPGVR